MIIIPDIHGRSFWKHAVEKRQNDELIIFLGDYLDPYYGEIDDFTNSTITKESAFDNFKEIIEFAKTDNNTILLLGNHDTSYCLDTAFCREDKDRINEISELFKNNWSLFKLAHYEKIGNKIVTFSHSCITKGWLEYNNIDGAITEFIDQINANIKEYKDDMRDITKLIGQIGSSRLGLYPYGSMVWADMSDFNDGEWESENVYQIFGHTQRKKSFITKDFAMLDCHLAFHLKQKDDNKIEILSIIEKN